MQGGRTMQGSYPVRSLISTIVLVGVASLQASGQSAPTIQLQQGFDGPTQIPGFTTNDAADPNLAVGLSYVVCTVNAHIWIFNKSGVLVSGPTSLEGTSGFFANAKRPDGTPGSGGMNASSVLDPHCIY